MHSDADQLARLRVATTTGRLPRDLGEWLLDLLEDIVPAQERLQRRVHALKAAARLIPGSRWAKARELVRLVRGVRAPDLDLPLSAESHETPAGLVRHALCIDPNCPTSLKQMLRIID